MGVLLGTGCTKVQCSYYSVAYCRASVTSVRLERDWTGEGDLFNSIFGSGVATTEVSRDSQIAEESQTLVQI